MFTHSRSRRVRIAAAAGAALAALAVTAASSQATSTGGSPPDLRRTTPGNPVAAPLKAGAVYQASLFPLALRVTARGGAWIGDQYRTTERGTSRFGWAQVAHPGVKGLITIVTAYGATSSVAATIARLRLGGSHDPDSNVGGTSFGDSSQITIAGYTGRQYSGAVWGIYGHTFVPFTPQTHGTSPSDHWYIQKGERFQIMALNVRGKTVVVFLESAELPADQFDAFLTTANQFLGTLRFPAG